MKSKALTLSLLVLVMSASYLFAEPSSNQRCCQPTPMGGIEALMENTAYPTLAQQFRMEANVTLKFRVDESGFVSSIQVVQSGGPLFDESAIAAVENTKWSPALQNGTAIPISYSLPFEYRFR